MKQLPQWTYNLFEIGFFSKLANVAPWRSLHWIEKPLRISSGLVADEVIIPIRAVGLDLRDTLTAMGLIPTQPGAGDGFGVECAEVVLATGPLASHIFNVNDRVMVVSRNAYATATVVAATNCVRIPDRLSFDDATTMPCVYPTAIHGIINQASVEKDQTILIHPACGAVRLAAPYPPEYR
jgi:NADPH:quinone reductase-like Zn-dependent oxidoreductase